MDCPFETNFTLITLLLATVSLSHQLSPFDIFMIGVGDLIVDRICLLKTNEVIWLDTDRIPRANTNKFSLRTNERAHNNVFRHCFQRKKANRVI